MRTLWCQTFWTCPAPDTRRATRRRRRRSRRAMLCFLSCSRTLTTTLRTPTGKTLRVTVLRTELVLISTLVMVFYACDSRDCRQLDQWVLNSVAHCKSGLTTPGHRPAQSP